MKERIKFIKRYVEWLKKTPNGVWSAQQAEFINALLENAKNFPLSKKEYLKMKEKAKKLAVNSVFLVDKNIQK
ncbi:hypothetical protein K1720_03140 [Thermococcus argininiproducens]|uniref:Uncharacterized protein n=2 Tax=Thermococcus argininiproducens TaxID=2866384 RepID=A0A9E7MCF6_9EURY|nr:hypothetical protein K1720_03140 [Thermococcus argininiproducens]